MRLSPALLLTALLSLSPIGCAHRNAPTVEIPTAPPDVASLDDFEVVLNRYTLLPDGHDARGPHRAELLRFLVSHLQQALDKDDETEALVSLRFAVALYSPQELRTTEPQPALAEAAERLYARTARRGAEFPSMLALAVQQRFAPPKARPKLLAEWEALEKWLTDNGPLASEPLLAHEELERALESLAAYFPSPFVVQRLADLYVARYDAAVRAHARGGGLGNTSLRRVEITGYLLMRLYLRADDPKGAIEAMGRVERDDPVAKLSAVVEDAFDDGNRSARPLLSLSEQFVPEPDVDTSLPHVAQSWGIIDNLMRRAVVRYPKDPFVHLMRARALRQQGLDGAAVYHLRASLDLKDDVFETWQMRAELEQQQLEQLTGRDIDEALVRLGELEAFHKRAMKLWRDRPVLPALPRAYFTVAEALYQRGRVIEAKTLLDRSVAIEARPEALDLLGTIALKRADFDGAAQRFESLARLPFDDHDAKLRWELRAQSRLGEIAQRRDQRGDAEAHLQTALGTVNELLGRPAASAAEQADRYVERGRLLFLLGDVELATRDFEQAATIAPGLVKAYAEPMLQLVSHGHYSQARDVFRRALAQRDIADDLKLYFCLWLNDLALRQGLRPDRQVLAFLAEYRGDRWAQTLAEHAQGTVDYETLLAAAGDDGQRAEAFFYEALRRWRFGDTASSKQLLQRVLDSDLMGFYEYDMAQAYLRSGELSS